MLNIDRIPAELIPSFASHLAAKNGVTYKRNNESVLAEIITSLSDDDVNPDDTQKLLIALTRANVISGHDMVLLLSKYLNEKFKV